MSTPNRPDERAIRQSDPWLRRWTRNLRDWLNVILEEPASNLGPDSATGARLADGASHTRSGNSEARPAIENLNGASGPPEGWLNLVREGAPELLLPVEEGGTSWSGIRALAGQGRSMDSSISEAGETRVRAANSSIALPEHQPLPTTESAPIRQSSTTAPCPGENIAPRPALLQSLTSRIAQVLRRHRSIIRPNDPSPELERMDASASSTIARPTMEAISSARNSSNPRYDSVQEKATIPNPALDHKSGEESRFPKTATARDTNIGRGSTDLRPTRSSHSYRPVDAGVNQTSVSSGRYAAQTADVAEAALRKVMQQQYAINTHSLEKLRATSAITPAITAITSSVQPGIEPVKHSPPAVISDSPALPPPFRFGSQGPQFSIDAFSARDPQPAVAPGPGFAEVQGTTTPGDVRTSDRWAALPSAAALPPASFADAHRGLDHLRRLDREQQGGC